MTGPEMHRLEVQRELLLDPANPRLNRTEVGASQERLISIMIQRFKLEELAESIIASGYLPFDPIIAYRDGDSLFVREGNRRLAAIKLLLDPSLAPDRQRTKWEALHSQVTEEVEDQINELDVTVFDTSDDPELNAYIGFRHVTGVLQWPPLEKAKFIASLIDEGWDYATIAERLGSYPRHVERHYIAHQIVQQAAEAEIEGWENLESSFGVLLRALQAAGIASYIGVVYPHDPAQSRRPISEEYLPKFVNFVRWTFGTEETARVLPDSRRLTDWGTILQSREAVQYLENTPEPRFERAWARSGGQAEGVRNNLWNAAYRLEEAVPLVVEYSADEEVKDAVAQCALFLSQVVAHFPELDARFRRQGRGNEGGGQAAS